MNDVSFLINFLQELGREDSLEKVENYWTLEGRTQSTVECWLYYYCTFIFATMSLYSVLYCFIDIA